MIWIFLFLAIVQSSLKFNGHLVVRSSFETNIEHVYAAGPVAEFVPNNSLITLQHFNYNSVEVGARVANILMQKLGVLEGDGQINTKYVQPLSIYCKLPGNYNYLNSAMPGLKFMKHYSKILKTENADTGYFEIVVDNNDNILQLSCYSKRVSLFNITDIISLRSNYLRSVAV